MRPLSALGCWMTLRSQMSDFLRGPAQRTTQHLALVLPARPRGAHQVAQRTTQHLALVLHAPLARAPPRCPSSCSAHYPAPCTGLAQQLSSTLLCPCSALAQQLSSTLLCSCTATFQHLALPLLCSCTATFQHLALPLLCSTPFQRPLVFNYYLLTQSRREFAAPAECPWA
jgi:hypothetical protein